MLIALFLALTTPAHADAPMELRYSEACIFQAVAAKKHISIDPKLALPPVFVASRTPLKQFQDAIEPQWNLRPDAFLNAYVVAKNEIYLIDDSAYYTRAGRFIDDSLAHELTHYVQVVYQHADLSADDSLEADAVDTQTWFRETFMKTGASPCAL